MTEELLRKVVLIGAAGTVGSHILNALLEFPNKDNFDITVLARPESTSNFPGHPNVKVVKAPYDDIDKLINIFEGHDAVIHASAIPGLSSQKGMIEAAARAHVKRFILNEFANSYDQKGLPELEPFREIKREFLNLAKNQVSKNGNDKHDDTSGFSWTALATGNFLDYSLMKYPQIGIDLRNRSARLIDGGEERFSASILPDIGIAVRGILRYPNQTKNRFCYIRSVETCQKEILACSMELIGEDWKIEDVKGDELYERGRERWKRREREGMIDMLVVQLFKKGRCQSIVVKSDECDNDLLGVKEKNIKQIVDLVRKSL